jgi:hypothetical protein
MADRQYAIVRFNDSWRIVSNGHRAGNFRTREEALERAAKLAREARALGNRVELLVQNDSGRVERRSIDALA